MTGFSVLLRLVFQMVAMILLMIPFFGPFVILYVMFMGIPGIIVSLLIFVPIEAVFRARGWPWFIVIPVIGAAVPWVFFPSAGNTNNFMSGVELFTMVTLAWAVLWVVSGMFWRPPGNADTHEDAAAS